MRADGSVKWVEYEDIYWYDEDFVTIGEEFESESGAVRKGRIGEAEAKLFSQREMVDFAVEWMNENRRLE